MTGTNTPRYRRSRSHVFPAFSKLGYNREISPSDRMLTGSPESYFAIGLSALECICLALKSAGVTHPGTILDLPCGHGRVTRMLEVAFPGAHLTACDLDRDGVDYCARMFGATPVYSHTDPDQIQLSDRFDLIWVGSLLTHLNSDAWLAFLSLFARHLTQGGVLVFSVHGGRVAAQIASHQRQFAISDPEELVAEYLQRGFSFRPSKRSLGYGVSLCSPAWLCKELEKHPSLELLTYTEGGWNNSQDVVGLQRTSEPTP